MVGIARFGDPQLLQLVWNWPLRIEVDLASEDQIARVMRLFAKAHSNTNLGLRPVQYVGNLVQGHRFGGRDVSHLLNVEGNEFRTSLKVQMQASDDLTQLHTICVGNWPALMGGQVPGAILDK